MKKSMKRWLSALSVCFLLTGCGGKKELPEGVSLEEGVFNPQSTVRTRVQEEIENNQSYQNIEYIQWYSLGAKVEELVPYIQEQFQAIAPHMNTSYKELTFKPIKSDGELSMGSSNHYYLVNEKILVNFVVPESNSVKWDGTVSDIQFYYDVFDGGAINLMDLIAKSMIQEIESPQTRLTIEGDEEKEPITDYDFNGGVYEAIPKQMSLPEEAIDWIGQQLDLKELSYLYCFSFNRY